MEQNNEINMSGFSDYSDSFSEMISSMKLKEIAKFAETSRDIYNKIKSITIASNGKYLVGVATPYNIFESYSDPIVINAINEKILSEKSPKLLKKYLGRIISTNNLTMFKKFFKIDGDPYRTIVEVLKYHKDKSDLLEYVFGLERTDKFVSRIKGKTLGDAFRGFARLVSFFLKNTHYTAEYVGTEIYSYEHLRKFRGELGYLPDGGFRILRSLDKLLIYFTENEWKKYDIHIPKHSNIPEYIAEYNADRELSYKIYENIYSDDEQNRNIKYFSEIEFWKYEYGLNLFAEKCKDTEMLRQILEKSRKPLELIKYTKIDKKILFGLIKKGDKTLFRKAINEDASVFTDESGYIRSDLIRMAADGSFADVSNLNPHDIKEYFNESIPLIDDNDDNGRDDSIKLESAIKFLLDPVVVGVLKNDNKCVDRIYDMFTFGISELIYRLPISRIIELMNVYGLDIEIIYKKCKRKMNGDCDQIYETDDAFELCEKFYEIRNSLK